MCSIPKPTDHSFQVHRGKQGLARHTFLFLLGTIGPWASVAILHLEFCPPPFTRKGHISEKWKRTISGIPCYLWLHSNDTQAWRELELPAMISASGWVALSPFKSQRLLCHHRQYHLIFFHEQLSFDFPCLNLNGWNNVCNYVFGGRFLKLLRTSVVYFYRDFILAVIPQVLSLLLQESRTKEKMWFL